MVEGSSALPAHVPQVAGGVQCTRLTIRKVSAHSSVHADPSYPPLKHSSSPQLSLASLQHSEYAYKPTTWLLSPLLQQLDTWFEYQRGADPRPGLICAFEPNSEHGSSTVIKWILQSPRTNQHSAFKFAIRVPIDDRPQSFPSPERFHLGELRWPLEILPLLKNGY